jgi:hypothetical protein
MMMLSTIITWVRCKTVLSEGEVVLEGRDKDDGQTQDVILKERDREGEEIGREWKRKNSAAVRKLNKMYVRT